jgi:hypothetical protein
MLMLLAIAVVGWAVVWHYAGAPPAPEEPPAAADGRPPAPVEPDRSAEFETVTDKTPLRLRDMAAYEKLLRQARETTPGGLASVARRDVIFAQLFERPEHYRGVPLHLLGTTRYVLRYESKLSRTGWLYEAWVNTADSQKDWYVCVFEDAPKGFPVGADVSERVVFNGYFLKLMRYEADRPRAVPLLVGRIGWTPRPAVTTVPSTFWLAAAVGVIFVITMIRWLLHMRRFLSPRPRPSILRDRPAQEIAPEALAEWLETVSEDDEPSREPGQGSRTEPPGT